MADDEDPRLKFGRILRKGRLDAGMSQQEVAERLDPPSTQKFVSQVERGEADPRLTTLVKFLRAVRKRFVFHSVDEE